MITELFVEMLKTKSKLGKIILKSFLIIIGLIGLTSIIFITYKVFMSDEKIFSIGLIAAFSGLLFEGFRISKNWKRFVKVFIESYLLNLLCFLIVEYKQINNFENEIDFYVYSFFLFFLVFFIAEFKDKLTAKFTEGVTLLLSISLTYWIVDYGFINYHDGLSLVFLILGLLFLVFSIINAFTYINLSRINRLLLSIWSTAIVVAFGVDNIIGVLSNTYIESSKYFSNEMYVNIQYFLLGVSVIYILHNYLLLASFVDSKDENRSYDLIEQYSDEQVSIKKSFFVLFFTVTAYCLNYKFQILPRHTMIWLVLLIVPLILHVITLLNRQKTTVNEEIQKIVDIG